MEIVKTQRDIVFGSVALKKTATCIELNNFQDQFEIIHEVIGWDITAIVEYSTSQVYAINYKIMEYEDNWLVG
jgi:hypothetical protein